MPVIYQNDTAKHIELREQQWVRIKNSGPYNGDIALVEAINDSKVWVRLIPRIDPNAGHPDKKKAKNPTRLPLRVNFRPEKGTVKKHIDLGNKEMTYWNNQYFFKGFIFKQFPFK
jgi:hypothetical protein